MAKNKAPQAKDYYLLQIPQHTRFEPYIGPMGKNAQMDIENPTEQDSEEFINGEPKQ